MNKFFTKKMEEEEAARYEARGTILVADPNSEERSLMEWEPQLILDELSASTANGAPLWVLSPAET